MKSSKRIYGEQFEGLQKEDLLSCLNLSFKFGYVSKAKLTLIREFVASKSINEEIGYFDNVMTKFMINNRTDA